MVESQDDPEYLVIEKLPQCDLCDLNLPQNKKKQAMFICREGKNRVTCQDSLFYCGICGETKHDHRPILVENELKKNLKRWFELKKNIISAFTKAAEAMKDLKPLIIYLENCSFKDPHVKISSHFKRLSEITPQI